MGLRVQGVPGMVLEGYSVEGMRTKAVLLMLSNANSPRVKHFHKKLVEGTCESCVVSYQAIQAVVQLSALLSPCSCWCEHDKCSVRTIWQRDQLRKAEGWGEMD